MVDLKGAFTVGHICNKENSFWSGFTYRVLFSKKAFLNVNTKETYFSQCTSPITNKQYRCGQIFKNELQTLKYSYHLIVISLFFDFGGSLGQSAASAAGGSNGITANASLKIEKYSDFNYAKKMKSSFRHYEPQCCTFHELRLSRARQGCMA